MPTPFENRRWLVIPSTLVESINFDEVLEFNQDSLRYSLDGTQTFIKYDINIIEEDIVKPKAAVQKLSYNEKREFETLEKDMPLLEKEKQDLEINMSKEGINFDQIQLAATRVADIIALLEEKELRWLELSERL